MPFPLCRRPNLLPPRRIRAIGRISPYSAASAYRVFRDQYFPLIHWGKVEEDVSGRMVMPVAIQANHVLVDGVHVGRFYGILEELCGNQFS